MATATSIGPIGARQINNNLYVGRSDLTTIQAAVTAGVAIGSCSVIIPAGYAGSDSIASLTGGSATVNVIDKRNGQRQSYNWSGTNYIPSSFQQLGAFSAQGLPKQLPGSSVLLGYDPTAGLTAAGAGALISVANPGKGYPRLHIGLCPEDAEYLQYIMQMYPDTTDTFFHIETVGRLELLNTPNVANLWTGDPPATTGSKGMSVQGNPTQNAIDLQGQTIGGAYDQTIRLNYLGGSVAIGPVIFDASGHMSGIASITASSAAFNACTVDGSPVLTEANTGDVFTQPPAGIVVSTGAGWASSINPATLATWPAAGIAVSTGSAWGTPISPTSLTPYPSAGVPVSTGTAWGASIAASSLATWPAVGIAVSTGSAWGTPIDPTSLTPYPSAGVPVSTGTAWGASISASSLATWPSAGVPVSTGTAWGTPIVPTTIPRNNTANTFIYQQTFQAIQMVQPSAPFNQFYLSPSAAAGAFSPIVQAGDNVISFDNNNALDSSALSIVAHSTANSTGLRIDGAAKTVKIAGAVTFANPSGNLAISSSILTAQPSIRFDTANNLYLNATGTAGIVAINFDSGHGVTFYNGAGTQIGKIDTSGNATFSGTISAAGKTFNIPHPLDREKRLVHGCLEGPEYGVYYRGEGETKDGAATITLPPYFEAITLPEGRTVQLTELFEDDEPEFGNFMAAGRVKDGKFNVRSSTPTLKFYWEVMAIRADINQLEVEPMQTEEANDTGADRTGEGKDGKLPAAAPHHAAAATAKSNRTKYAN